MRIYKSLLNGCGNECPSICRILISSVKTAKFEKCYPVKTAYDPKRRK
jgi:hypothetical protein